MAGSFGGVAWGGGLFGGGTPNPSPPTTSGGGFRPQNMQDLLGAIIAAQSNNGLTAATQAQTAVLNTLIGWGDTLPIADTVTATLAAATLWDNFAFNGGVFR